MIEAGEDIHDLFTRVESGVGYVREADTKVTPYANKNSVELFCESFALYLNGDPLPDDIITLMEDTMDRIEPRQMDDAD